MKQKNHDNEFRKALTAITNNEPFNINGRLYQAVTVESLISPGCILCSFNEQCTKQQAELCEFADYTNGAPTVLREIK